MVASGTGSARTSLGTSRTTGPGRPEAASVIAMSTWSSTLAGSSIRWTALAQALNSFTWSSSWKALRSRAGLGTSWTMASTGTDALNASESGGTRSVAAGPFCAATTPTRPVTLA